jgi:hypothetical protein
MNKPAVLNNPVDRKRISELVATWKSGAGVTSSLSERFAHSAYRELISLGEPVVPYLLAELEREPDWWFAGLKSITGADPVPADNRGKLGEMTRAWLQWGRTRNPVDWGATQ